MLLKVEEYPHHFTKQLPLCNMDQKLMYLKKKDILLQGAIHELNEELMAMSFYVTHFFLSKPLLPEYGSTTTQLVVGKF